MLELTLTLMVRMLRLMRLMMRHDVQGEKKKLPGMLGRAVAALGEAVGGGS